MTVILIVSPDPFTREASLALLVEVLLTTCVPISSEVGCTTTSAMPAPVMARVWGLPAALSLMSKVALKVPAAVGKKLTSIKQLLPGAIGPLKQLDSLVDTEKSAAMAGVDAEICALPTSNGPPPVFVRLTPELVRTFKGSGLGKNVILVLLRLTCGAPPDPERFIVTEPLTAKVPERASWSCGANWIVSRQDAPAASVNPGVVLHGDGEAAVRLKSPEFVPPKAKLLIVTPEAVWLLSVTISVPDEPTPTS